jgi:hypothetical protein
MGLAAILVAVLLAPLTTVRTAWFLQDAGSSSAPSTATDQAQPNATSQEQDESRPDRTPDAKKAEAPGTQKSSTSSPSAVVRKHRSRSHKPPPADGGARKIVVHKGGTSEPIAQILPGITEEEANRKRQSAEQLLAAAESSLKGLAARTLNPNQQELIVQIRQYMDGARSALKESDIQRAHTLALKAHLLSDDLVKH